MDIENILEQKPIIRGEQLPCTVFTEQFIFRTVFGTTQSAKPPDKKMCDIFLPFNNV